MNFLFSLMIGYFAGASPVGTLTTNDALGFHKRQDGRFDAICPNLTVEVVSLADVGNGNVCPSAGNPGQPLAHVTALGRNGNGSFQVTCDDNSLAANVAVDDLIYGKVCQPAHPCVTENNVSLIEDRLCTEIRQKTEKLFAAQAVTIRPQTFDCQLKEYQPTSFLPNRSPNDTLFEYTISLLDQSGYKIPIYLETRFGQNIIGFYETNLLEIVLKNAGPKCVASVLGKNTSWWGYVVPGFPAAKRSQGAPLDGPMPAVGSAALDQLNLF